MAPAADDDEEAPQTSKVHVAYIDGAIPGTCSASASTPPTTTTRPTAPSSSTPSIAGRRSSPVAAVPSGSGRGNGGGGGGGGQGGGPGKPTFVNNGGGATVSQKDGQTLIYSAQANGLAAAETRIDYQEFSGYLEMKATDRLSGFVELPVAS